MNGFCRFLREDGRRILIGYGVEDKECAGRLSYDKATREFEILELSGTENQTRHLICALRSRLRLGYELNKLYYLAVG